MEPQPGSVIVKLGFPNCAIGDKWVASRTDTGIKDGSVVEMVVCCGED